MVVAVPPNSPPQQRTSALATQARKLRWRARFLRDPAAFAADEPFFRGRCFPIRELLLAEARALPAGERLRFVSPFGRRAPIEDLLLRRRLRRLPDAGEYFDLGGDRIFFRPEHGPATDAELLEGILLVLKEAYAETTSALCAGAVQARPGDTVLDLGGFVGTSALLFSRLVGPGGRVYSFEPIFHDVLERNLRENRASNVRVIPRAVGDAKGVAAFAITDRGIDGRLAGPDRIGPKRPVAVTTVDDFVREEGVARVDFIKMDIEGAEEPALRGAQRVLERWRPRLSIASYHTENSGEKQHPKIVRLLSGLGYRITEDGERHIYAW